LKPTRGAIPGGPDFGNLLNGLASELVVSRSLRDTAAALDAVAGAARGPASDPALGPALALLDRPPDPLRIGMVLDPPAGFALETARRAAVAHAAEVLARAGHHIVPLEDHALDPMAATAAMVFDRIISTNLAYGLGRLAPQLAPGEVEPLTAAVAARGHAMTTGDLIDAHLAAARLSHRMAAIFERCDVLLTPMLASAPLLLGSMPMDHHDVDLHWQRMQAFAPYVAIANAAGIPALAVPHGRDDAGLPLSVQLLGPMTSDALLLRLARQLESAEPWRFAAGIAGEDLAGEDLQ
jgi:amidase